MAVCLVVALCSANVLAVGILGTPTAELEQNKWDLGFNYMYSTQDLAKTNTEFGFVGNVPSADKMKIRDFNVQRYYLTLGYGVTEWWEVYAQIGVADTKMKTQFQGQPDWNSFNFDNDMVWGLGTRITVAEQDRVKWGITAQMNWFDTELTEKNVFVAGDRDKHMIDGFDFFAAFGPTVDMGGWNLYGGPFYYCLKGDFENKYTAPGDPLFKETGNLRQKSHFGGFIGAQFDLYTNTKMNVEFSGTPDGWAVGTGIAYTF